jgi:hypothetical protein
MKRAMSMVAAASGTPSNPSITMVGEPGNPRRAAAFWVRIRVNLGAHVGIAVDRLAAETT